MLLRLGSLSLPDTVKLLPLTPTLPAAAKLHTERRGHSKLADGVQQLQRPVGPHRGMGQPLRQQPPAAAAARGLAPRQLQQQQRRQQPAAAARAALTSYNATASIAEPISASNICCCAFIITQPLAAYSGAGCDAKPSTAVAATCCSAATASEFLASALTAFALPLPLPLPLT